MTYLSKKTDMNQYMIESSNAWSGVMMPLFYVGSWKAPYQVSGEQPAQEVFETIKNKNLPLPDYIVFSEAKDIKIRVANIKKYVKGLLFEKTIESSFLDKTMHFLNPVNVNQTYYIYKVKK